MLAWFGASGSATELNRTEAPLDRFHEVVAVGVPLHGASLVDVRAERGDHLIGVDGCGETDAGSIASAIEVGDDDEQLVGQRVVFGQPRT